MNTYTDAEIFSPPYLFTGTTRPVIDKAPEIIFYGKEFEVQTQQASDISRVSLIRLGAVTHSFDQDARYVPLPFSGSGDGRLQIDTPAGASVAPPGYYMLFLVSSEGVPSIARFVRILPSGPGANVT